VIGISFLIVRQTCGGFNEDSPMALTDQRYEEIDASLQRIHDYLIALAAELDAAATATNKQGETYPLAVTVAAWVAQLRHALQTDQEQPPRGQLVGIYRFRA
jgi:hypothetical protein